VSCRDACICIDQSDITESELLFDQNFRCLKYKRESASKLRKTESRVSQKTGMLTQLAGRNTVNGKFEEQEKTVELRTQTEQNVVLVMAIAPGN
jgi:hypothetical protein